MTAVSLVPSQDRPYVDGSPDDSVYMQVFDYNGVGRLTGNWVSVAGPPSPLLVAAKESGRLLTAETMGIKPSWHRLLAGPFAAGSGWLLPAAVAGALGVLISRRRQGRRDPLRAAVVLWGGWWLVLAVFFSVGTYLNSYYVAAHSPAVAALCGTGIAACGPRPWLARVRLIVAATVLGCVGYGAYLVSGTASGPVVFTLLALVVAAAAAAQLLLPASGRAGYLTAVAFAGAAVLLLPAAASVSSVIRGLGPFDTPFESPETAHHSQALAAAPALTRAVQRQNSGFLPLTPCSAPTRPGSRRTTSCTAAGRCCLSAATSATCPLRRWPRCGPTSAAATCGYSCCRCHRRARTRGCGGSSRTAPGGPSPRTAVRSRTRASFADPGQPAGRLTPRPGHLYCGQVVLADRRADRGRQPGASVIFTPGVRGSPWQTRGS